MVPKGATGMCMRYWCPHISASTGKPLLAFEKIDNVISMLMNLSYSGCDSENWNEATAL